MSGHKLKLRILLNGFAGLFLGALFSWSYLYLNPKYYTVIFWSFTEEQIVRSTVIVGDRHLSYEGDFEKTAMKIPLEYGENYIVKTEFVSGKKLVSSTQKAKPGAGYYAYIYEGKIINERRY
ncbi:hypothetical protein ACFOEK_12840 [Litoribrevibacter euphylliae]|uniref:Uncharacterized protein n=1 Tax=Litoribrevibacter euphylliae TaxID=1834034 RepID=A0ABV7HDG5_9GAMM